MAFLNKEGRLISYNCGRLIKEASTDLMEFGDSEVVVILRQKQGVRIAVDWFPVGDDYPELHAEPELHETEETMLLSEFVDVLKKQDDPEVSYEVCFNKQRKLKKASIPAKDPIFPRLQEAINQL